MASPAKPWDRAGPAPPQAPALSAHSQLGDSGVPSVVAAPATYGAGFVRPSPFAYGNGYGGFVGFPPDVGGAGFLSPHLATLSSLHYTVGSIGAIAELIGVNAEALLSAVKSSLALVERVGQATGEVMGFLRVRPPLDPATGLPVVSAEQYAVQRRQRLVRWVIGAAVIIVTLALLREGMRGRPATGIGAVGGAGTPGRAYGWLRAALVVAALFGGAHAGRKLALALGTQASPQPLDAATPSDPGRRSAEQSPQ